jgi:hypothetical protein
MFICSDSHMENVYPLLLISNSQLDLLSSNEQKFTERVLVPLHRNHCCCFLLAYLCLRRLPLFQREIANE